MPRKRVSQFTVRPRLPRVQAGGQADLALGTAVGQGRQADAVFHIEAAGAVGPAEDGVKKGLLLFVGHAAASVAVSAGVSSSLTSSPRTT